MKASKKRLQEIERKGRFSEGEEVIFYDRIGDEWTEEEKQWIRRRHPDCKIFMKPFSRTPPYGFARQGKAAVALFNDLAGLVRWNPEKQKKHDDEIRKRVEEESRMINERWLKKHHDWGVTTHPAVSACRRTSRHPSDGGDLFKFPPGMAGWGSP